MSIEYVEKLAAFAARLELERVPPSIRDRARLVLLDSCGAILGGRSLPEARSLAATGGGPLLQALVDGTSGVSQELDEGCASARGHPGIHVVPAVLAAATERGSSGREVLSALIAGYEVAARMGAAMRLRNGLHPHGTWGTPGGAVAAGRLIGLTVAQLTQAIRLGATLSLVPDYTAVREGVTSRNLWAGLGNVASLVAAHAAAAGYEAPVDAPATVYGQLIGTSFDSDVAAAGLGEDWYLARNYFKVYACCRHIHAPVDAFRAIVDADAIDEGTIERIDVFTYAKAADATGRPGVPKTPLGAKFSVAYVFAVYLRDHVLDDAQFNPPTLGDPSLDSVIAKIHVAEDPAYTAMLPDKRGARVEILFRDGSHRTAEVFGSKGDPADPLSRDELEQKFRQLAIPAIGEAQARALSHAILHIEDEGAVNRMTEAMKIH